MLASHNDNSIHGEPPVVPYEKVSVCDRYEKIFECKFEVWRAQEVIRMNEEHDNATFTSNAPSLLTLAEDQHLLFIPLQSGHTPRSYAVGFVFSSHPNVFLRLAESYGNPTKLETEINRLTEERHSLLTQVTIDFEELSFLRRVAPELSRQVKNQDIGLLARTVFEMANLSSKAEGLLYFQSLRSDGSLIKEVARYGTVDASTEQLIQLVRRFRTNNNQPDVLNHLDTIVDGDVFTNVRNFILVPVSHDEETLGWILALNRREQLEDGQFRGSEEEFSSGEATILNAAAKMLGSFIVNIDMLKEREQLLTNVVLTLVSTIEAKDAYTCGHSERVARYAQLLAKIVGYDADELERIYLSGLLHDIGKIGIPDSILRKPEKLTEGEFELIKQHPLEGWEILSGIEQLSHVRDGVLFHHENVDGSGYPYGQVGENIPLDGRILSIADALDAMTSNRSYRAGMSLQQASEIIAEGAGKQWDENLVKIFQSSLSEFVELKDSFEKRIF